MLPVINVRITNFGMMLPVKNAHAPILEDVFSHASITFEAEAVGNRAF